MAEVIDLEKCNFWNFRSSVTLTLDRVTRHTIVHQSSTSIYTPNFIEIGKTFCGWLVGWSLTSLFSTNTAISETKLFVKGRTYRRTY